MDSHCDESKDEDPRDKFTRVRFNIRNKPVYHIDHKTEESTQKDPSEDLPVSVVRIHESRLRSDAHLESV